MALQFCFFSSFCKLIFENLENEHQSTIVLSNFLTQSEKTFNTLFVFQAVVEYSEISKEEAEAKDEKGDLRLNTGNICIHAFSLSFLKRLAQMRVWETMPVFFFSYFPW